MTHAAQASLNEHLRDARKKDKRKVEWNETSTASFEEIKKDVLNIAVLAFPCNNAETRLVTDASDTGIGAALEQKIDETWKPLAFFSRKLTSAQRRYSTYDRELTAMHVAIKHFLHFSEGREFCVLNDHKPLTYALLQISDKASSKQQRQVSYISQFINRIQHISGEQNVVADALSRLDTIALPTEFTLDELAEAQSVDSDIKYFQYPG